MRFTKGAFRRPLGILTTVGMVAGLVVIGLPLPSFANHSGTVSGVFESDDGNLAVDEHDGTPDPAPVDWNSFTDSGTADDWNFVTIPDATGNPDSIYDGGVKQDHNCPGVKSGSLGGGNSKFDIERVYLSHRNIDGDEFLFLGWVRVPQNSTTASSHIAYEFNKGETPCPAGSDDLVQRTAGDMLVVYDFEGGQADPTIKVSRWVLSGACEVSNSSAPCWGNTIQLGTSVFDAKVNTTSVGPVVDELPTTFAPPQPVDNLGIVEFGEAGINLTAANIFDPNACEGFGTVTAVSRSSGNSGTAQMKDKVGPDDFDLANCGSVLVQKVDENEDLLGGATVKITPAGNIDTQGDVIDEEQVSEMTEVSDGVFCEDELFFGDFVIFESDAPVGYTPDDTQTTVSVDEFSTCDDRIENEDDPDVVITNNPEPGDVEVAKVDDADNPVAGAVFTLYVDDNDDGEWDDQNELTSVGTCTTDTSGDCYSDPPDNAVLGIQDVDPGFYCMVETTTPDNYETADPQCFQVELADGGDLIQLTFVDPRLHKVIVIVCHQGTDTLAPSDVTDGTTETTTIGSDDLTGLDLDEGDLCGLDGYEDYTHDDEPSFAVNPGSDAHTSS